MPSVLFAGGGTGGHLFPALAIADELRRLEPDAAIVFVGTKGKIEARQVPARGYRFRTIWIGGFRRKLSPDTFLFPVKLVVALVQSALLIRKEKPDVVVGTGGYVCGPVGYAAKMLGVPLVLHEQNSVPGATIRMLARKADQVHLSFEASKSYLKGARNVLVSGNPTGREIGSRTRDQGAKFFGLDPRRPTLLVFGGSLGAATINRAVLEMFRGEGMKNLQLIWQTGEQDYEKVREALRSGQGQSTTKLVITKFIEKMEFAYAACDLALCRAGATTIAELTRSGTPAILVPYPYATADHQTRNAGTMVEAGAAVMCPDGELGSRLPGLVRDLLGDPDRLKTMARNGRALGRPDAAGVIARAIMNMARGRHGGS